MVIFVLFLSASIGFFNQCSVYTNLVSRLFLGYVYLTNCLFLCYICLTNCLFLCYIYLTNFFLCYIYLTNCLFLGYIYLTNCLFLCYIYLTNCLFLGYIYLANCQFLCYIYLTYRSKRHMLIIHLFCNIRYKIEPYVLYIYVVLSQLAYTFSEALLF